MNRHIYLLLAVSLYYSSCNVLNSKNMKTGECIFDKELLTVTGTDYSSESIEFDFLLIRGVGRLMFGYYDYDNFDFDEFNKSRWGGDSLKFAIKHCSDTLWAKNVILEQVKKDYFFETKDTFVEWNTINILIDNNSIQNRFDTCEVGQILGYSISHKYDTLLQKMITYDTTWACAPPMWVAGTLQSILGQNNNYNYSGDFSETKYMFTLLNSYEYDWSTSNYANKRNRLQYLYDTFGVYYEVVDTFIQRKVILQNYGDPVFDPTPNRYKEDAFNF